MTVLCVLSWIQTNTKSQMNLERSNIHKSENLKIEFQTIFQGHNSSFNFNACWHAGNHSFFWSKQEVTENRGITGRKCRICWREILSVCRVQWPHQHQYPRGRGHMPTKQQLLKFKLYVGSCQLVIVRRVVKYTATLQPPGNQWRLLQDGNPY